MRTSLQHCYNLQHGHAMKALLQQHRYCKTLQVIS